eukprot:2650134-Prorocentrum_lima.AAC.1
MTSSLVGSEMCIRDRFRCPSAIPPEHGRPSCHKGLCYAKRPEDNIYSVSYTHLTLPTICSV